ncbi:MAG: ABC transporter permease subunit [Planctomycetota bacterium]|nr:ABC transporter permease subunit [Planctomycetota bacterium]
MSRPLVIAAAAIFALVCLAPVAVMAARVGVGDFEGLLAGRTLDLLGRTVRLGLGAAAVAVVLGFPYGFLVARTDMPLAGVLRPLGLVPFLLPPLFLAITWTAVSDVRGATASVWVLGANTFPLVALFTARAFERIDARREEAALLVGGLGAALRMELPLVLPGAACGACLAFVFAVNDFAVPDYVSSVGPKFNVYADEVFASWQGDGEAGRAVATALPLVLLTLALLLPALALRRRGALATVDGDFRTPAPLALGRLRWPALVFCGLVLVLCAGLPLTRLAWEAGGGTRGWSVDGFRSALSRTLDLERTFLANSLVTSAVAASLCAPLALVLGHALERSPRGRRLEVLAVLPIAVPAILFGIGNIALWNRDVAFMAAIYDGRAMIVLLFIGRFLVFPLLITSGAVASLDPRLEEAAELAGARPATRLARIVAPGVRPSLVGGWTLVFVLAMRELDAAILVPAANGTVIFKAFNRIHFARDDAVAALCLLIVFFIVLPGLLWSLFGRRRLEVIA